MISITTATELGLNRGGIIATGTEANATTGVGARVAAFVDTTYSTLMGYTVMPATDTVVSGASADGWASRTTVHLRGGKPVVVEGDGGEVLVLPRRSILHTKDGAGLVRRRAGSLRRAPQPV